MARKATVALDGKEYVVHAFNLKELQELGEVVDSGTGNIVSGMKILRIALRRSDPVPIDVDLIEPTMDELNKATQTILKLSGIESQNPQTAAPAES